MILAEAIEKLKGMTGNTFAQSLASSFSRFGKLSPKQEIWAMRLATEQPKPATTASVDFAAIGSMFSRAGNRLKYPKVRLSINGQNVRLSRAGANSKNPGAIYVTDGEAFADNKYFGKITPDGIFTSGRHFTQDILNLLREFEANPLETAAKYGKLTGCCSFCGKRLTDDRSTAAGYGPTCADTYGLEWGN